MDVVDLKFASQTTATSAQPAIGNKAGSSRIEMLDAMRLVATAGVIWAHIPVSNALKDWALLGRFGVPFYLFAAALFMTRSFQKRPEQSVVSYLCGRASRLMIPFLAWDVIHLVFSQAKHTLMQAPPRVWGAYTLLEGVSFHLWFLPFLFLATCIAAPTIHLAIRHRWAWWSALLLFGALGIASLVIIEPGWMTFDRDLAPTVVFHNFWEAVPSAMLSIPLALLLSRPLSHRASVIAGLIGLPVLVGCSVILCRVGYQNNYWLWFRTFAGIGLLLMALSPLSGRLIRIMGFWGKIGFGIYLSHILILSMVRMILSKLQVSNSPAMDLVIFAIVIVSSAMLTWAMSQNARLAWIVGQPSPAGRKSVARARVESPGKAIVQPAT